jgi:hypothetical protein
MTMHLCGPALTTTGKRKGKKKFASAAQAQAARELDASWKELCKRQGVEEEERKRNRAMKAEPLVYSLSVPADRNNAHIKSLNSGAGVAVLKPVPVYTGDKMIGIGQLHKSNAVPVFREEDIKDIARMRR